MQLAADPEQLTAQISALLADQMASSAALLELALLCLQTGHLELATRLGRSGRLSADHRAELQALETIDLLSLYSSWKATSTAGWSAAAGVPSSSVNPLGLSPGVAGAERAHLRRLALQGVGRPVSLVRVPPQPDEPCPSPIVPQSTWRRYWMAAAPGS